MMALKFMLLVAPVLVTALVTNANDSYQAVEVDAISSTHSKELAGKVENGLTSTTYNFQGRKIGGKVKNVWTHEGGYGNKQNLKDPKNEDGNDSGFVAFNADYHAPRHHPPKNN